MVKGNHAVLIPATETAGSRAGCWGLCTDVLYSYPVLQSLRHRAVSKLVNICLRFPFELEYSFCKQKRGQGRLLVCPVRLGMHRAPPSMLVGSPLSFEHSCYIMHSPGTQEMAASHDVHIVYAQSNEWQQ